MINRLKNLLILIIVVLFIPSCTAFKAIKLVNGGEAVTNNDTESLIPFTIKEHPILIKTRLNHSQEEYTFIFDTGALTLIRQEVAKELGLPKGIEVEAGGTGGQSKKIDLVKIDRIVVGKMEVQDCATGVTDFSGIFPAHIAGILGSNFLRHFVVTIDYRNKHITFSHEEDDTHQRQESIIIPFKLDMKNGFAPEVICVVDSEHKNTAIIDTGFPGIVALPAPMVKKTKAFKNGKVTRATGSVSGGFFGMAKDTYGLRMGEFQIGDLKRYNVPTISHHSKNRHVLIGNKFIDKYVVTLNYPAKKMILIPYGLPFETNIPSYGVALIKNNEKTVVSGIWNNSSASKCGIKIGDEVTKLNAIETNKLSSLDLIEIFLDDQSDTIEIEFLSNQSIQSALLYKEMLLPDFKQHTPKR